MTSLTSLFCCKGFICKSSFCHFLLKLFELLGPEGLDLIEKLLQNRITIVDRFLNSSTDYKFQALQGKSLVVIVICKKNPCT